MHEAAIIQKLVKEIEKECKKNRINSLSRIILELGQLTNYKKEPVQFYYSLFSKETRLLSNAELVVNEIEGMIQCNDCKSKSKILDPTLIFCPLCQSSNINIIKGNDFIIKKLEGK